MSNWLMTLILGMALSFNANATLVSTGDHLASFSLKDQHEQLVELNKETRYLLFSRDMQGGDIIQSALESLANNTPHNLLYVADISGMPSLIAKFIAIPQLKSLPFAIALDRDGEATKALPTETDKASLVRLDGMEVISVEYFETSEDLRKALQ